MIKKLVTALLGVAVAMTFVPVTSVVAASSPTAAEINKQIRGAKSYAKLMRVLKSLSANSNPRLVSRISLRAVKLNPQGAARVYIAASTKTSDRSALVSLGNRIEAVAVRGGASASVINKVEQTKEQVAPTPAPYAA